MRDTQTPPGAGRHLRVLLELCFLRRQVGRRRLREFGRIEIRVAIRRFLDRVRLAGVR